jgi:nitroimidazol reductase NimA-like FMN-containing flavoprotein (pyridoxamine 5'-phosphate oxidase superfamily)
MPEFSELREAEAIEVLRRNHIGRVAFIHEGRVDIEPLHYVYEDDWIYGRTSFGEKLNAVQRQWWVAFEVDEINGLFDWRSVVVHGGFYLLPDDLPPRDRERRNLALRCVRRLVPEAFTENDPAPHRTQLFGIDVQQVSGRAASTV